MRPISEIIVHCSATKPEWMKGAKTSEKVAEIKLWHTRDRGWSDIGYHYLIDRDGTVANGRPVALAGAHVKGRNAQSIGVCLIGGYGSNENDDFSQHFTAEQDKALRLLLQDLLRRFGNVKISGHNEYAAKACPGFRVGKYLLKPAHPIDTPVYHDEPAEQGGWLAALIAAIAAFFGDKK